MAFVQIIDFHTSKPDEIRALEEEWRGATDGTRTLRRSLLAQDRADPEHYLVLAFFDDYDSAMVNSNLPETGEFGRKQTALCDGPMRFVDLDVIEDYA
jgi:hypothetical protein